MARTVSHRSKVRAAARRRADGRCEVCADPLRKPEGDRAWSSLHHRFPRREGGRDSIENLLHLCCECHTGIHRDEAAALETGLITFGDPAEVPFWFRQKGWRLLTADGQYASLGFRAAERRLSEWSDPSVECRLVPTKRMVS